MGGKSWREEEIKYLVDDSGNMADTELANILGRTMHAVRVKRHKLGLKKTSSPPWSIKGHKVKKEELEAMYSEREMTIFDIERVLRIPKSTVFRRLKTLGIPIRKRTMKGSSNPMFGRHLSQESKTLISMKAESRFKDQAYRDRIVRASRIGCHSRPTAPEAKLIQIINANKFPFRYTGDGSFIINGLNPDFMCTNNENKLIEVFGRAFHDPEQSFMEVPWQRQYFGRMAIYSQLGYKCLILWDDELKNEKLIIERIGGYINN